MFLTFLSLAISLSSFFSFPGVALSAEPSATVSLQTFKSWNPLCKQLIGEKKAKKKVHRAGFEPATYGWPHLYSPPLYQLSYRWIDNYKLWKLPYKGTLTLSCQTAKLLYPRRERLFLARKCRTQSWLTARSLECLLLRWESLPIRSSCNKTNARKGTFKAWQSKLPKAPPPHIYATNNMLWMAVVLILPLVFVMQRNQMLTHPSVTTVNRLVGEMSKQHCALCHTYVQYIIIRYMSPILEVIPPHTLQGVLIKHC